MPRARYRIWSPDEAEAWNLEYPRRQSTRELRFLLRAFEKFAEIPVRRVLDLGCGTGRLSVPLALQGYQVTGIDKFHTVLTVARRNADEKGVQIMFAQTGLDILDVKGRFDAAFSVQSVFNYLLTNDELDSALSRCRKLLRHGGVLIIDMMNFMSLLGRFKRTLVRTRHGKGWSIRRQVQHQVDDVGLLWYHKAVTTMKIHGRVRRWKETHVLRMWAFPELRRHLAKNGFGKVRLFGGFDIGMRPAKTHAPRLIIVAVR